MAKKKKRNRKRSTYKQQPSTVRRSENNQEVQQESPVAVGSQTAAPNQVKQAKTNVQAKVEKKVDDEVGDRARREVRHSLLIAAAVMAGLIGLWCLFSFTSLGREVYKLFLIK